MGRLQALATTISLALPSAACDVVWGFDRPGPGDAPTGPSNNLVAWYTMDRLEGRTLVDASGSGHDGACLDLCPDPTGGIDADALRFRGNSLITIEQTPALELSAEFTVGLWVKAETVGEPTCAISKPFGPEASNTWQVCMYNGYALVSLADVVSSIGPQISDEWHHLALRFNSATLAIALDGTIELEIAMPRPAVDSHPVIIGGDLDYGVPAAPFSGLIDNIVIYDRALLPSELAELDDTSND